MWSARYFEDALKRKYYYNVLCTWVKRNSGRECYDNLMGLHPEYNGTLLDYYHKDTVSFYSEQLKYASVENVSVDDIGIAIHGWGRYTYFPLEDIGCLGMLYALIDADPYVYESNKEIGNMIMMQLQQISPLKAKELQKIIACESFRMSPRYFRKRQPNTGISIANQFGPVYNNGDAPKEDPLDAIRRYAAYKELTKFEPSPETGIDANADNNDLIPDVPAQKSERRASKSNNKDVKDGTPKIIASTFEYQHKDHKEAQKRVMLLFRVLSSDAFQRIDSDAKPENWEALFSGEPSTFQIKWTGTIQHLYTIFYKAKKRKLIRPKGAGIWQIVSSHFVKEDDSLITAEELNGQHPAKEEKDVLDLLVDILDVAKPISSSFSKV